MNSWCAMHKLDILNLNSNWHFWLQELPAVYMILYKLINDTENMKKNANTIPRCQWKPHNSILYVEIMEITI